MGRSVINKNPPCSEEGGVELVLLGEHNCEYARRFRRISRVLRAEFHLRIVIIDLEIELATIEREVAEVMLAMRVVIGSEIRERRHTPDYQRLDVRGQSI